MAWNRKGRCQPPNPTLPPQSATRADRFRSGPLGQAPRTMDLVKEACRTHGGEFVMRSITQGLCRWRARNSSRIILNLSSRPCAVTQQGQSGIVGGARFVKRYIVTHDSFLPTIVPDRSSAAPHPHAGEPRKDSLRSVPIDCIALTALISAR